MAKVFFDNPMNLSGTAEDQLRQLYGYLFNMSEKLNEAMNSITIEQLAPETTVKIVTADKQQADTEKTYNSLKSMIIKTANIVRSEMEEISTVLHGNYTAISDQCGTLVQDMQAEIRATAQGVMQEYSFDERITEVGEELENFRKKTNQYIFSGLVDSVNMKYGIAIGYNVTGTDANGGEKLNDENKMATFTSDELAFYVSGQKAAWFSNDTMFISKAYINTSIQLGGHHTFKMLSNGFLVLTAN